MSITTSSSPLFVYYWCKGSRDFSNLSPHFAYFVCKSAYSRSGAEGIRTPDLRRAKAERRFRRRSLSFEKPLKQAESANRPTTDVRLCSPRLSSNCRQLHTRTSRYQGKPYTRIRKFIRHPYMLCWGAPREKLGKGVGQTTGRFYAGCWIRTSKNLPSTHSGE
jgi:hypothetical protein